MFSGGGGEVKCYKDVWGLLQVPIIFEDDVYLLLEKCCHAVRYLEHDFKAARVFNFHPIHIFLNTDTIACYEKAKKYTKNYKMLEQFRNKENYGVRDLFKELICLAKERGYQFCRLREIDFKED